MAAMAIVFICVPVKIWGKHQGKIVELDRALLDGRRFNVQRFSRVKRASVSRISFFKGDPFVFSAFLP
jgi:hypothetical protein